MQVRIQIVSIVKNCQFIEKILIGILSKFQIVEIFQGQCRWTSVTGRNLVVQGTTTLQLSDIERVVLQQVALAKLQQLNLGVNIRLPAGKRIATLLIANASIHLSLITSSRAIHVLWLALKAAWKLIACLGRSLVSLDLPRVNFLPVQYTF